jgi:hypothetical protein
MVTNGKQSSFATQYFSSTNLLLKNHQYPLHLLLHVVALHSFSRALHSIWGHSPRDTWYVGLSYCLLHLNWCESYFITATHKHESWAM